LITQLRYDEAFAESDRAVALEPGSPEGPTWSGFVLAYTGPYEWAGGRLRHAGPLDPKAPRMYASYQALAAATSTLGHDEGSLESASQVAQQLPEWHGARIFVPAKLGRLRRAEEARPLLKEALLRWPHYTVRYAARRHPYRHAEARQGPADGLRRAGMPD
jgi:hypothetical protein